MDNTSRTPFTPTKSNLLRDFTTPRKHGLSTKKPKQQVGLTYTKHFLSGARMACQPAQLGVFPADGPLHPCTQRPGHGRCQLQASEGERICRPLTLKGDHSWACLLHQHVCIG